MDIYVVLILFQFPSNGKADPDEPKAISRKPSAKRISVNQNLLLLTPESREPKAITQFPSNGIAFAALAKYTLNLEKCQIPFCENEAILFSTIARRSVTGLPFW